MFSSLQEYMQIQKMGQWKVDDKYMNVKFLAGRFSIPFMLDYTKKVR